MASAEGGRIDVTVKAKALSDVECGVWGVGGAEGVPGCRLERGMPLSSRPKNTKIGSDVDL